jgi:hypothetical protein
VVENGAPGTGLSEVGKYVHAKVEADMTLGQEEEEAFPETKGTAPDATVVVGETKYSVECRDYSSDDSEVEDDWDAHTDGSGYSFHSDDDDQVVMEKADVKFKRFVARLHARYPTIVFKEYTAADYVNSDEEEVVHDNANVEAAP